MDSLARLLNSYYRDQPRQPVVTAVGLRRNGASPAQDSPKTTLAVAHNTTDEAIQNDDERRLNVVSEFLRSPTEDKRLLTQQARQTAASLSQSSGLPRSRAADQERAARLGPRDRLARDLLKLKRTYDGLDSQRSEAMAQLSARLREVFEVSPPSMVDLTIPADRGAVHAESALVAHQVGGPIGVSKLSCGDCDDYAVGKGRKQDLRGTHGGRFPGWVHPDIRSSGTKPLKRVDVDQYASDSSSDADFSDETPNLRPKNKSSV
ncbi:hypothetical protein [Burkholderia ubonensis]|uniref:hypothetical protein n=1 Tax=Burkholderia ubonensis TaxID=101571 RepID=UPI0018DFFEF3|nr:hypothetical protein [Burkholderia ubonensis]